jgi:two-component system, OmpR family, alkaline phosphatase synthesis response regulator PhoP
MADAWIYSSTRSDARELADAFAELGYTPRHVLDDDALVPPAGAGLRPPDLAVVDRPALVSRLRRTEALGDVPLLLVADPERLPSCEEASLAHELVVRPFTLAELETRVARATRRGLPTLRAGEIELDPARRSVTCAGEPVELTFVEFELLRFLLAHADRVFTREALLARVWGYAYYGGARTVDVHVRRLRAKLGEEHANLIQTVRSVGYRFGQTRWPGNAGRQDSAD